MTGKEYTQLAMRTKNPNGAQMLLDKLMVYHSFSSDLSECHQKSTTDIGGILNACLGLSGEVGETVDMIKKWVFHGSSLDETHLKKEIGDIMWYIACICHSFGYDLDEIMQMNIDKHWKRYPNGFNVYDANHRKNDDI